MTSYFIQGFFFQKQRKLGIGMNHEGSVGLFGDVLYRTMYAGIFYPDPNNKENLIGEMMDEYGKSILTSVFISRDKIEFIKQYEGRKDFVKYELTQRADGTWVGSYFGDLTGKGYANCILTEVSENFLNPQATTRERTL